MKKLILPLLLLLAIGMLAAVESDPSEVVGYVKYQCLVGNNLVALPMDQGFAVTSEAVAAYNGDDRIDSVNIWNALGQYWDTAVNYGGNYLEPDLDVDNGSVLFFSTSTAFDFFSIGPMFAQNAQYSILAGNNTVMIPLNKSELTLTSEFATELGEDTIDSINMWNAPGQYWDTAVNYGGNYFEPDFDIAIASPLFFSTSEAATWPAGPRAVRNSNSK